MSLSKIEKTWMQQQTRTGQRPAEASQAAAVAAARVWPPRPVDWAAAGAAGAAEDGQMGNASAEAAMTAAGGAAEDGPGAAVEATAGVAAGVRPPRPANRDKMTRTQRRNLKKRGGTRIEEGVEGTTEVAVTAQQGAVAPVSHSDGQAAAETVVEEGSEDLQMGSASVEAAMTAAGGAAEDGSGAAVDAGTRGS